MTMSMDWLSKNTGGGDGNPGVYFGTPGMKVIGKIADTPKEVDTQYGARLVVELVAVDGSTALKGTEGVDGVIEAGDEVTLWVKPGLMAAAIRTAITAAGADGLSEGDTLAVQYTGDGEKKPGKNPPKIYAAQYQPAKAAVSVDSLI